MAWFGIVLIVHTVIMLKFKVGKASKVVQHPR